MRAYLPSSLPALRPPTQAQIATVTDGLEYKWSHNALAIQDRLTQAVELGQAADAQKWAIAGGISTEKVLLLKGRPTEITGHFHAHRHELGPLMDRLAQLVRPSMASVSVTPVTHSHAVGQNARVIITQSPGHDALPSPTDAASNA